MKVVDRGSRLWLEMPRPGPTVPLVYLGNSRFASTAEPDAHQLAFSAGETPDLQLLMGAMHWYGPHVSP